MIQDPGKGNPVAEVADGFVFVAGLVTLVALPKWLPRGEKYREIDHVRDSTPQFKTQ
ncbi:MAG: hypothetical protein P8X48_03370 [Acidiferrobacteraceae bacterium]|jgi:hypothetical protein